MTNAGMIKIASNMPLHDPARQALLDAARKIERIEMVMTEQSEKIAQLKASVDAYSRRCSELQRAVDGYQGVLT